MEAFFKSLGMPVRLQEEGIKEGDLESLAKAAFTRGADTIGNFVKIREADAIAIFRLAYR